MLSCPVQTQQSFLSFLSTIQSKNDIKGPIQIEQIIFTPTIAPRQQEDQSGTKFHETPHRQVYQTILKYFRTSKYICFEAKSSSNVDHTDTKIQ